MDAYTIPCHKHTYTSLSHTNILYAHFPYIALYLFIHPIHMYHVQIIVIIFTGYLLCARYSARCFTWIILGQPYEIGTLCLAQQLKAHTAVRLPGLESWLHHYLTSESFSFPICKVGALVVLTFRVIVKRQ